MNTMPELKMGLPSKSFDADDYTIQRRVKIDYQPHLGQALFHASTARFRIVCCGRKWGKTTMLVWEAFRWLGRPDSLLWWVAPYFNLAALGMRRFIEEVPPVTISHRDRRDAVITMVNGSQIWFKSADNPDSLLGEGIDLLIIDEAARVKERTWLQSLRPNLDDARRMGHCSMASTPTGHNWFYKDWLRGVNKVDNYESWAYNLNEIPITKEPVEDVVGGWPSWSSDFFTLQSLEEALNLPRLVFLQEYGGRFLKDLGAVFRDITKAISGEFEQPIPDENYYMGVDLAKTVDYTVITVLDKKGHVVFMQRLPQGISWPGQVNRIVAIAKAYNEATLLIDSTGLGDPVFDYIKIRYPHVQGMKFTAQRKMELIDNLSIAITTRQVTYPEIPALIEELSLFGVESKQSSRVRYEAPRGFNDDHVISLALAAWLVVRAFSQKLSFEFVEW